MEEVTLSADERKITGRWRSANILDERLTRAWPAGEVLDFRLADTIMGECWRLRRWPWMVLKTAFKEPGISVWWRSRPEGKGYVYIVLGPERLSLHLLRGAYDYEIREFPGGLVWWCHVRDFVGQAIRWLREVERG